MKPKMTIKQDENNPVPQEVIAAAIIQIAGAMKKIRESRLSDEAIVALIKDKSGIMKNTIRVVLNNLEDMEKIWLKPKKK